MRPSIYTASKIWHAPKWRLLREIGVNVQAAWIDVTKTELTDMEKMALWLRCVDDAARADFLLLYAEPTDILKGALVEAGSALASGTIVLQVGECPSLTAGDGSDVSFTQHPHWWRCLSIADALKEAGNL